MITPIKIAAEVWAKVYPDRRPFDQIDPTAQSEWEKVMTTCIRIYEREQWHDLQQNPKDLPSNRRDVEVYVQAQYWLIANFREDGWYTWSGKMYQTVVAWRELKKPYLKKP
jgi:hypothetical protein